ncbi:MAG TPA: DUF1697 domain-containing protein [Candidatus Bathyarchaeia archaeon]|nr:DUF1697 domain-containing protein [Candidatus Bathyarchaeia archaeon]
MATYVALLRGINVGGQKIVDMEKLRSSFEALGYRHVRSYLQSGNVIFEAAKTSADDLSKIIRKKILSDVGFPVSVIVRTANELKKIAAHNPFLSEKSVDHSKLHVTFSAELPAEGAVGKLDSLGAFPDRFLVKGREIYLYCPNGYGRTKLSNNAIEKVLSVKATTRNWNTVGALVTISSE